MDEDCSIVSLDEPKPKQQRAFAEGNDGKEDRISTFHDAILIEILSLLPIQYAAMTSVLSRRWSNLWTFITAFRFDSSTICKPLEHVAIIDHIFSQLQSPQIQTFQLHLRLHPDLSVESDPNDPYYGLHDDPYLCTVCPFVGSWIQLLCSRQVQHIEIKIFNGFGLGPGVHLPSCLFESKSLLSLVLSLKSVKYCLPDVISLPNLKLLSSSGLDSIFHYHYTFFSKLSNKICPRLEELTLCGFVAGLNHIAISSQNLKKLCIILLKFTCDSKVTRVDIDAPNLESFVASFPSHLVTFKFAEEPFSVLRVADLMYRGGEYGCSMEVFQAIRGVRALQLNSDVMDALNRLSDDSQLPKFGNLIALVCSMSSPACWKALLSVLHRTPKIRFLAIKMCQDSREANQINWVPIDCSAPPSSLQHLKKMKICLGGVHVDNEMELIKYFLCYASALEELIVEVPISEYKSKDFQQQMESELLESLSKLPSSSSSCHIEVHGIKPKRVC